MARRPRDPLPQDRRPRGAALGGGRGRRARPRPGPHPPHRRRPQLHRHLSPHRPLSGCRCRAGIGIEAAGVVEAVGAGVTDLKPGDRVAYAGGPLGAYAEARAHPGRPAHRRCRTASTTDQAAAMMLQGLTAQYLLRRTYRVQGRRHHPGPRRGRRRRPHPLPVGQASRRHRHRHGRHRRQGQARQGAWLRPSDRLPREDFVARVQEITGGSGVPVVYDSASARTPSWSRSTACGRSA